ncbi:hypothetical protein PUMCH_001598 [Australozyma saopauloensis]|uniref:RING-type domain-containing protein n=1 Tax=Australozyma saopauloensis TaxID=291208 RepID=A0AAX4H772_9ASCO|nr:hypothetical protein PUMCH_001598 [[Candida] saopauloensis]
MWTRGHVYMAAYAVTSTAMFAASLITSMAKLYDFLTLIQELTFDIRLIVLLNFIVCFYLVWMLVSIRVVFGEIRVIEMEHIADRIPFLMLTLLFLLLDDENLILDWIWFGLTLCMKVYHTILYDRIDYLQVRIVNRLLEGTGGRWAVFKMYVTEVSVVLLAALMVVDVVMAKVLAYDVFQGLSAIESLLFGIQFGVMGIEGYTYLGKLTLNMYEVIFYRLPSRQEEREEEPVNLGSTTLIDEEDGDYNADVGEDEDDDDDEFDEQIWENKAFYVQTFTIFLSTLRASFYMVFLYMLSFHTNLALPGTIIQGCITSLYQLCKQIILFRIFLLHSRRLDNHLFTASESELAAADHMCIICRENMHCPSTFQRTRGRLLNARKYPKKLRCGHILHLACLKDWLERSDSCPLCRQKVFATLSGLAATTSSQPVTPARPQAPAEQVPRTATPVAPTPAATATTTATANVVATEINDALEASDIPVVPMTNTAGGDISENVVSCPDRLTPAGSGGSALSAVSSSSAISSFLRICTGSNSRFFVPRDWSCHAIDPTDSPNRYSVRLSDSCVASMEISHK